jgi:acyl-CoA synthetase (AMP-forming)/AMP-acid ligase II
MRVHLVHEFLERCAGRTPDQPFLVHEGRVATYAETDARAKTLGSALIREGLEPGERVALLARNSPLYVEAYYGILKAGGVAVPLNTAADPHSLAYFLGHCGARHAVIGAGCERSAIAALAQGSCVETMLVEKPIPPRVVPAGLRAIPIDEARAGSPSSRPDRRRIDLDVASIIYTSGSTGRPQGATLTHGNLVANVSSIVEYLELGPSDRVLAVLPFYYVYGKSILNTHAAVGATVVIENRFQYPNTALDTLEQERCTGFAGVPSTFAILLHRSNLAERTLEHLRYVTQAGGPMSPRITRQLIDALPGKRIFVMYGATEAGARLSYVPPERLAEKIGSIGIAIPNVELTVRRPDGTEAAVREEGELVARGSNLMRGYWNDPEATAHALDAHGYHTGDLGYRDDDGFLFLVGRKADMIKAGAHRVSAKEIEEAILEHPSILEAAVIGVEDEILGERIVGYVALRDGAALDVEELRKDLKRRLPLYKVPSEIHVRDELPKNESGKIQKRELRSDTDR